MTHTFIGYARCSTDKQDLASQKEALLKLGVTADRIYTDHFTGTTRERPGLDQALAAVRSGIRSLFPKSTALHAPFLTRVRLEMNSRHAA